METKASHNIAQALNQNLVFVHGKGGVGKTLVSQAIALCLSQKGNRTLWVTLEDPTLPTGELKQVGPSLWYLNSDFTLAFEEYAAMKIRAPRLTSLFLNNKLMRYLAKAAPGVHELVLLGKIWHERINYSHVIVDMPSTGYGLALFQSAENFSKLFRSGPLNKDAEAMLETFKDPQKTGHLIVALAEETPLRESLELNDFLIQLFPKNPPVFIANRLFPAVPSQLDESVEIPEGKPSDWKSPLAHSSQDYARKRYWLESYNLRLWKNVGVEFGKLGFIPPPLHETASVLVQKVAEQLKNGAYL